MGYVEAEWLAPANGSLTAVNAVEAMSRLAMNSAIRGSRTPRRLHPRPAAGGPAQRHRRYDPEGRRQGPPGLGMVLAGHDPHKRMRAPAATAGER